MAHRIGDGQVQSAAVQRVVVRVATDVVGRDQPGGKRELGRLAAGGRRKQLVLDLRGQAGPGGAPAQMVQIGEAAVRDDDVGQRVGGLADLPERGLAPGLQRHLQHADAVAPVGDRCDDPPAAVRGGFDVLALTLQDLIVETSPQLDGLGRVVCGTGRGQAHQALTYQVNEQERHPLRPQTLLQVMSHHVDGLTGRGGLRSGQQFAQFQIHALHSNLLSVAAPPSLHPRILTSSLHCA